MELMSRSIFALIEVPLVAVTADSEKEPRIQQSQILIRKRI
jgi:hypothetical protein